MQDRYSRIWYAEFSEGSHAQTDWQVGGKAVFTDNSCNGIVARIVENKPAELLDLEYTGTLENGKENYESDMAIAIKGSHETYRLNESGGVTHLHIASDMGAQYFEMMSEAWDRALQKVKGLAEAN